jgi:hypothetical protein
MHKKLTAEFAAPALRLKHICYEDIRKPRGKITVKWRIDQRPRNFLCWTENFKNPASYPNQVIWSRPGGLVYHQYWGSSI